MTGTIALQGGGPFVANDDLDRAAAATRWAPTKIVMLPTADAFEHPERLVAAAMTWGERLDVEVEALMVLRAATRWTTGRPAWSARPGPSTWSAISRCTCARC